MHIACVFWSRESSAERVIGWGSGATMREAMAACFVPVAEAGRSSRYRYRERDGDGEGRLTRFDASGVVVAYWRGVEAAELPPGIESGPPPAIAPAKAPSGLAVAGPGPGPVKRPRPRLDAMAANTGPQVASPRRRVEGGRGGRRVRPRLLE
jgi:hypothetical protein